MKCLLSFLRRHSVPTAIGLIGLYAFAALIIKSFCNWNFPSEGVFFDSMNYFWSENFKFFSIPHFEWHSDCFLYPYGCDITFIFWAFEMGIFNSLFERVFGDGPWGQWYYLFSLGVTYFGTYALLVSRKGRAPALFFAFVLTFCNYASICKFPGHFAHCVIHWSIISVLFDVVTVEKFWQGSRFTVRFVLARMLVLLLCFGLELGYVAGFACFSFFVTCVYLLCATALRKHSVRAVPKAFFAESRGVLRSVGEARWMNLLLLCAVLVVAWAYLPVIFQIVANVPPQMPEPVGRTNLLRIFLPIFPGLNPATTFQSPGLMGRNTVDTIYAWSAGWSALMFFGIGITAGGRKNVKMWLPFLVIILFAMVMYWVPVIKLFPAFKCARIPERFSLYLLLILVVPLCFSCREAVEWLVSKKKAACILLAPVLILWVVEIATAYSSTFLWAKACPLSKFPADYEEAVRKVRDLPGEALFFMPFSTHGADARMNDMTSYQMQFAAKCGKKMNGFYAARGWDTLFSGDFSRMNWCGYFDDFGSRMWSRKQWGNLERFLSHSDFCAAVIAVDMLPPAQHEDIVAHLGRPIANFSVFGTRYEVIPMPERLRGEKNLSAICEIFNFEAVDTEARRFADKEPPVQLVSGFGVVEPWGVWTSGTSSEMRLAVPKSDCPSRVVFNAMAFSLMKTAEVYCGERKLADWVVSAPPMTPSDYVVDLPAELTGNAVLLRFELHDPASPRDLGINEDARILGLGFVSVRREDARR